VNTVKASGSIARECCARCGRSGRRDEDCCSAEDAVTRALEAIREMDVPHLEWEDENQIVH
jgi:hypothetical protein